MHKIQTVPVMAIFALLGAQSEAVAAPSGAKVAAGNVNVTSNQTIEGVHIDTLINQVSDKGIIDWKNFDIAPGELVRFVQNGTDAVTLNRIAGDATQILGSLQANGKLFLVNPNGIVFGSSAQVDVAGLVATTFDIANEDFMNGKLAFEQAAMNDAEVRNQGTITIGDNGFAYLVAPNVDNTGKIAANLGQVGLAADGNYTLDLQGTELIKFSVAPEVLENSARSVTNSGDLVGETVVLAAQGTETVLSSVVNDGNIQAATSFAMTGDRLVQAGRIEAGDIALDGEASVQQDGNMIATGRVDVDAGANIAMAAGTTTRADGDIRYNVDGDMQVASLTSKNGYIGLVADGSVIQTGNIATEGTSVEVIAGTTAAGGPGSTGDIVMAEGTRTQAVDDIRYTAGRDLTVETLVSQPDDNIELRAGRMIYQNADITAAGQVDMDAGANIAMAAGTTTRADGGIRYNVDGDMQVASLTSKNGYIGLVADGSVIQTGNIATGGTSVEVIAGTTAAGGPGSTGDIVMAEGTRTQAVDDIRYTAGRDLTVETLISQPDDNIELRAGRTIYQNADITAAGQVDMDAGANIAMAAGTTTRADGDIRYNVDGDMQVASLTSKNGYIGLVADGSVIQTGNIATGGTSVEVIAGTTAAGGPGSTGDIVMAEGTRTQAVDGIRYTAGRDLTVETLISQPDDSVELTAGRSLYQHAEVTAADSVGAVAGEDLVMARGAQTQAGGRISYRAGGALHVAKLDAENVSLVAEKGVLTAERGAESHVTANRLEVRAAQGIGASEAPLTTRVASLEAAGGNGGARIDNRSLSLTLTGLNTTEGELALRTAGDLTTIGDVANSGGGNLYMTVGGDMQQQADLTVSGAGDITVSGENVAMAETAGTTAEQGDIVYRADESLAVSSISTSSRLVGGRIVLDAPILTSNASTAGQVQGAFVRVASQSDDENSLLYMLGDPSEVTRIVVNQRTAGGQVTEKSSHFVDSLRTSTGQVTSRIDEAGMAPLSLERLDIHYSTEGTAVSNTADQ